MKHRVTRELHAYWEDLRRGRAAPERSDIDPAAIRNVLADTFMLEVEAGPDVWRRDYPIRLSGTRLNALFLREMKGSSLFDWWQADDRSAVAEIMNCVLDERAAMVAGVQAAPKDHQKLDLELLLLPLRHNGKTHARVMGCLAPAWTASWLGLLPTEPMTLVSFRHVDGDRWPAPPFATRFTEPASSPLRRGRFLVYEGGRQEPV